jgi:hypothetical protein
MNNWGGDQNYRPEKKTVEKKAAKKDAAQDSVAKKISTERDYRVGKTIAGVTNNARQRNLEHIAMRKKQQRKNAIIVISVLVAIVVVVVFLTNEISAQIAQHREQEQASPYPTEPTVTIVDENVGQNISTRVKTFVARLEADAKDYSLTVDHVTLPFQKAREILVYFVGRNEYYKMTTERGSTVQIEDAERMMRYLDGKSITPEYVDLRVEGKAYYK